MAKRKWHIGWPARVIVFIAALLLLSSILGLISMFFPYASSQKAQSFCRYVLPFILFLVLVGAVVIGDFQARRDPTGKARRYEGSWFGLVLGGALMSFGCAWLMAIVPAIPAKLFAQRKVDIPVTVQSLEGFRLEHDYWTWIYFDQNGSSNRFMWTRADPIMQSLKHGDCILLHAREWSLGLYVDSISRSNACHNSNAEIKESGTFPLPG